MSRFQLDLARHEDDDALRAVLAGTSMGGGIEVGFRREPSFFDASVVDGHFRQIIVGRDRTSRDRVVGFGSRSIRRVYLNGKPGTIGYLSLLRVVPDCRGRGRLLANAYRYLRELHADGQTALYLTTIAEDNAPALQTLVGGRAGLPHYHFAGRYLTAALPLSRRAPRTAPPDPSLTIEPARQADLSDVLEFLHCQGASRQFFPLYTQLDLGEGGLLRGLRPEDILLARRAGRIVGTLAAWDQREFRQTIVNAYHGCWRLVRPVYNGWASLSGQPRLPNPGDPIRSLMGALPLIENDTPEVFDALLDGMLRTRNSDPVDYLLLGFHESDPLLTRLKRRRATWYVTNLYFACWEDGEPIRKALADRPPYLELGSL